MAGALVGVILAIAGAPLVRGLLYGVGPFDPRGILSGFLVVVVAAFTAAVIPAWRASRVEPAMVLRPGERMRLMVVRRRDESRPYNIALHTPNAGLRKSTVAFWANVRVTTSVGARFTVSPPRDRALRPASAPYPIPGVLRIPAIFETRYAAWAWS